MVDTVVEIKISIDNPDDNLRAGYTANAKLMLSDSEIITVVPYAAVNQDDIGEFVYVLEDNTAVRRYVVTGKELSEGVEIKSGIGADDYIITVESEYKDGERVLVEK